MNISLNTPYTWSKPHSPSLVASGFWNVRQGPFRESPLGYETADIHLNWEYLSGYPYRSIYTRLGRNGTV
jgi:hypothetical protein